MSDMPGGQDLTYVRQEAIDTLLRMMGCTDARASNCEHVAAVSRLAAACYGTMVVEMGTYLARAIDKGNLIDMPFLERMVTGFRTELHIRPGVTGHREGHL